MYKFIQKNQKKFLAIFGVLLMIVFILPSTFKNNASRGDLTIGTINGEKITGNELGLARSDLELLLQYRFPPLFELGGGTESRNDVSVFAKYFHGDDGALAYLLLQKEAEKQGFMISPSAAETMANAAFKETQSPTLIEQLTPVVGRFMLVQAAFERASESVKASKPLDQYYISQAFQGSKLNLVEYSAAEMEKSVPAPTPEQILEQYAKYGESFPNRSFMTTQPSTPGYKVPDRVKLQYLELPHAAVVESVLNELSRDELYQLDLEGFRYYDGHRSEFPATAPATRPVFGPELPSSLPSTAPSTTTAQDAAAAVNAYPEKTKLEIRKRLLSDASLSSADVVAAARARVIARETQLRTALHDQLAHAYADWAAANAGDSAATQPAVPATNPLVAGYPDLDFLTAFANTFEAQYKVRPFVNSLANKWLTQVELETTPDIGFAKSGEIPFGEYALHNLAPAPTTAPASQPSATNPSTAPTNTALAATAPATEPTTTFATTLPTTNPAELSPEALRSWHPIDKGLEPFEPSNVLEDSTGNAYVFRLTAFEPAHRPPLADVEPEIVKQLKSAAAYQLAQTQAAKLLENARIESKLRKEQKISDLQGVPAAAKASGRTLIEAGPFMARNLLQTRSVSGYKPGDMGDNFMFLIAVEDLVKQQTPDNLHPSKLIELPTERKVLVAELGDTILGTEMQVKEDEWRFLPLPTDDMYTIDESVAPIAKKALMQTGQFAGQQPTAGTSMLQDWFDLNNVTARVKYIKTKG